MKKKIGIVNKYYPPYQSATGYHANHLACFLEFSGHDVHVFCNKGNYADSQNAAQATGNIHYSKILYKGKNKLVRLLLGCLESFWLIYQARKTQLDFCIVLSDPAFNHFWASILLKKGQYAFWYMDIYPSAFWASGLIKKGNPIYRFYKGIIKRSNPKFIISLGSRQRSFLQQKFHLGIPNINFPIGLKGNVFSNQKGTLQPSWYKEGLIYFAYLGNMGEAHDPAFVSTFAKALNPDVHCLILSAYGSKSDILKDKISNMEAVRTVAFLEDEEMPYIDIQLVSLQKQWTHICVPSKAISAIQFGQAVVFCGKVESDSWQHVAACGWQIPTDKLTAEGMESFIKELTLTKVQQKKAATEVVFDKLKKQRKEAYSMINKAITDERK